MSKPTEWRMMYEAPLDKPVLVWVPPIMLSGDRPTGERMEVAVAHYVDPRSGTKVHKFAANCRWTALPRAPRIKPTKGKFHV